MRDTPIRGRDLNAALPMLSNGSIRGRRQSRPERLDDRDADAVIVVVRASRSANRDCFAAEPGVQDAATDVGYEDAAAPPGRRMKLARVGERE